MNIKKAAKILCISGSAVYKMIHHPKGPQGVGKFFSKKTGHWLCDGRKIKAPARTSGVK